MHHSHFKLGMVLGLGVLQCRLLNSGPPVVYFLLKLSLFFDILSVTNIFCCTFPRNHASQPLQTWCGAMARGPTLSLAEFWSASYLLSVKTFIFRHSIRNQYFPSHLHQSHFRHGMVLRLGVLNVTY